MTEIMKVKCSVCQKGFETDDRLEFLCQSHRLRPCKCGKMAGMDWQVSVIDENPYYWTIACPTCGRRVGTRKVNVHELDALAVECIKLWESLP